MTPYAGLDVSTQETAICIVGEAGLAVWEGKAPASVAMITTALRRRAPGLARAGMETGPCAVWLWHGLRASGLPVDCIHARRAAAARQLQVNKTDRNDAHGLVQLVRSGWYEPIMMKSLQTHRVRAIPIACRQ